MDSVGFSSVRGATIFTCSLRTRRMYNYCSDGRYVSVSEGISSVDLLFYGGELKSDCTEAKQSKKHSNIYIRPS